MQVDFELMRVVSCNDRGDHGRGSLEHFSFT